jgi:hypothetical protein
MRKQFIQIVDFKSLSWIIICLGIVLRSFQYMLDASLWLDECFLALNITNRSFPELLKPLDYTQVAPVGFLIITKLMVQTFGNNEYIFRMFPFVCGIISIFLFFRVAKYFLTKEAVLIALGLFALSGYLIQYSGEFKQYSSDVAIALFLYVVAIYLQSQRLKTTNIALFGAIGAIIIWFSHPSAFVLAGIGISLGLPCLVKKEWARFGQLSIIYLIWLLSFAAFYLVFSSDTTSIVVKEKMQHAWRGCFMPFPPSSLSDIKWFIRTFFDIFRNPGGFSFVGIATLTFLIGCISIFLKNKQWFFILLSPLFITLLASGFHMYPFKNRLLLFFAPSLFLFIAEGAACIRDKTRHNFLLLGIIIIGLLFLKPMLTAGSNLMTLSRYRLSPVEDIKPVMHYIREHKNDGDVLYLYYGSSIAFKYYANHFGFTNNEYIVGTKSRQAWGNYTKELDKLDGNKRVWLLFSHVIKFRGVDEEKFFLYYLDSIGKRINHFKSDGAAVYLYDLSDGTHTSETDF